MKNWNSPKSIQTINSNNYAKFEVNWQRGSQFTARHVKRTVHVKGASMFLKFDPYRVWCSIFYSKLVNCILFKIIVQHVRFVKGRAVLKDGRLDFSLSWLKGEVRENLGDFRKSIKNLTFLSPLLHVPYLSQNERAAQWS
jgi:hypothetical protein